MRWFTLAICFSWGAFANMQLVDINRASQKQLMLLPGVGQKLADRIVESRQKNGPFSSVDDLARVGGLRPAVFEKIRGEIEAKPLGGRAKKAPDSPGKIVDERERLQSIFESFSNEPDIAQVHSDVIEAIHAQPERILSWFSRAHNAAWLPHLKGGAGRNLDQGQSLRKKIGEADTFYVKDAVDLEFNVQVDWKLDELIFSTHEMSAAREARNLIVLRDKMLAQATKDYFERRRLQVEEKFGSVSTTSDILSRRMRIDELAASLNALTGGKFSARIQ